MSQIFLNNSLKTLNVEIVHQPKQMYINGLKTNINELNRLIKLLDRPFNEILKNLDEEVDFAAPPIILTNGVNKMKNLTNSNSFMENYSDTVRVTQDLDHLLNSLSQYKLNQISTSNLYEENDRDSTLGYVYSEQLPKNNDYGIISDDISILEDSKKINIDKSNAQSIPICVRCNEPIYDNSICALDGYWHQHHFMCRGCDLRLEAQVYYVNNDQPFCEACHINLFTDKCAYCGEPILDSSLSALDQYWHPEHFFCSSCESPFDDNVGFHENHGKPYCSDCYFELYGHRCSGCNLPITSTFMSALGKKWHDECFVCSDCHSSFETTNFREFNGAPYCELHYHMKMGTICESCNKPIIGSLVSALGRKYHIDCFTCSYCLKRLAKSSFKDCNNRPYCTECFTKLCP